MCFTNISLIKTWKHKYLDLQVATVLYHFSCWFTYVDEGGLVKERISDADTMVTSTQHIHGCRTCYYLSMIFMYNMLSPC